MKTARSLSGVFAALVVACAQGAGAQPAPAPVAPEAAGPDLTAKLPGGVTLHGDITYSTVRGNRPLTLDLYLPGKPGPCPVVVFLHGGSWIGGARREAGLAGDRTYNVMARLAARGFVVASVSYRLSSEAKYPAPIQDLNAAIRFLRANAAKYGVDPKKVVTWGASAGSQVAINQALDCQTRAFDADPKAPEACPTAVVDWYGPADFASPFDSPVIVAYLGCERAACGDTYRKAGGVNLITDKAPPFIIVHGDADTTVPIAQSRNLEAALKAKGRSVEFHVVKDGEHAFRLATPAEVEGGVAATFAFIDKQTR